MKHKRCKGCNGLGHNLKTCVKVDLDMVYAKLSKVRSVGAAPAASAGNDSAPSSDGEDADEDVPVAIAEVAPERKRSRSHELLLAVQEGARRGAGRRAKQHE